MIKVNCSKPQILTTNKFDECFFNCLTRDTVDQYRFEMRIEKNTFNLALVELPPELAQSLNIKLDGSVNTNEFIAIMLRHQQQLKKLNKHNINVMDLIFDKPKKNPGILD